MSRFLFRGVSTLDSLIKLMLSFVFSAWYDVPSSLKCQNESENRSIGIHGEIIGEIARDTPKSPVLLKVVQIKSSRHSVSLSLKVILKKIYISSIIEFKLDWVA